MKIQIISDLHMEFGHSEMNYSNADLLIIAGDLHVGTKGINWLKNNITSIPVLYLLGNHEYYRGSYPKTLRQIEEEAQGTNIHILENKSIELGGITFHGATLWTDFELFGNPRVSGSLCQSKMNDYKLIRRDPSYSKMRSIDIYQIHKESLKWLDKSLSSSSTNINVVISHHAPSIRSVPEKYKNDVISAAYASNLEEFILKHKPELWIHGHIHEPLSYEIGTTKILCNPHGYINEPYNGYNKNLIIEL